MRQNFSFFHTVSCVTATQKSAKDNFHSLRSLWIEILKWLNFCSHLELVIIGWMWHVAVGLRSCISRTQVSFSQSAEGHCSCRARHSWPRSYWVIEPCKKDFHMIMWNIDINVGTKVNTYPEQYNCHNRGLLEIRICSCNRWWFAFPFLCPESSSQSNEVQRLIPSEAEHGREQHEACRAEEFELELVLEQSMERLKWLKFTNIFPTWISDLTLVLTGGLLMFKLDIFCCSTWRSFLIFSDSANTESMAGCGVACSRRFCCCWYCCWSCWCCIWRATTRNKR